MNKLSLEDAFTSYFHNKYSFSDFLNLDIDSQYTEIFYSKDTFSPSKKLKHFQQFLNIFIFDLMQVNTDVVFSYRKGVSTVDAIYPHKNSKNIYTTDIKAFFSHINIETLKKLILQNKNNFLINESDILTYIDTIITLVTYNNVLPIGAPTSPKISNAYLFQFDNKIQSYCEAKNIQYTRYSDDFIFSSNDVKLFSDLEITIKNEFIKLGFKEFHLNTKKTKIQKLGSKMTLLGLVIIPNGRITIDRKIKNEIEALLHFYLTDKEKFKDIFEKKYASNIEKVSGVLSHINSIDTTYISKLKKKYGSYIINSFIHRDILDD